MSSSARQPSLKTESLPVSDSPPGVPLNRVGVILFAACTILPARENQAQASRRDSLQVAEAVADTLVARARVDTIHRFGVLTMDRLRASAAHFEADLGEKVIQALRRRLPTRLGTIFSGDATRDQAPIPLDVVQLWVVNGGRIPGDSATVEITTVYYHRAARCTFGSTDETIRLRRDRARWRIVEIVVDTYADGICDRRQ